MLAWLSVWSEVQTCIWPSWFHCRSLSLASVKSRLVLPFWYRLTRVVPEKGPLNGCVCVCAAVDQWCPRRILNIRWHNFVRNADIRRIINQPPFHPSLSPVVSLSLGILHEWMRMQMLAKPSSNLLQRTGGDHRGGRTQLGCRTFAMTCLRWILGCMRLEQRFSNWGPQTKGGPREDSEK